MHAFAMKLIPVARKAICTTALTLAWSGLLLGAGGFAHAQPPDALYRALGEKPGITALMDDFVERLLVDHRIGTMFAKTKPANLKEQLRDQVCQLSGGPCKYEGDTMKAAHADLGVRKAVGRLYGTPAIPSESDVRGLTAHWGAAATHAQALALHDLAVRP